MMMRMRKGFALSWRLFACQQRFVFIRTEVQQVHTVVLSSDHPSLHLFLLLHLWARWIGSTSAYDTIRHQSGDTRTVAVGNHHSRLASVPSRGTASRVGVVRHRGYQVRLYGRGDRNRVHFSNTCFHLKDRTFC